MMTDMRAKQLAERLRHAITTASNDDYSEPMTEKRMRHIARIDAMHEAIEFIEGASVDQEKAMKTKSESFIGEDNLAKMRQAQTDHPATDHTSAGGWCKHCGCGNDVFGYKHLPNCTRPQ